MSGASSGTPSCPAAEPASATQLIAGLAIPRGRKVAFREEVRHPALAEPEVATGTMFIAPGGVLVRDQVTPERQISEVGDSMLSTRKSPDAEPTLYPIPAKLRPMLLALRRVLAGDAAAIAEDFDADLAAGPSGWTLVLRPRAGMTGTPLAFGGCGRVLQEVRIPEDDGVERTIVFSRGQ